MEVKMDNEQKMISPEGEPVDYYYQEFPPWIWAFLE